MVRYTVLVVLMMHCAFGSCTETDLDPKLEKFKSLPGPEQVAVVFQERFHGRSLLFWKRSSEVWLTAADARFSFEQDIVIASDDPRINDTLVKEAVGNDVERTRYATFLLCLRARFVPHSDFLIQQVVSGLGAREGLVSPFAPDLSRLDQSARVTIYNAQTSPNSRLRNSARIYSFALLEDLSSVPTKTLVEQWRAASRKVPACFHDRPTAYSDTEQSLSLLKAALASRGLEAAIAVSSLLKNERNAETRGEEIEVVRFIDATVIRLRSSPEGRATMKAVKEAVLSHPLQYCWMRLNETEEDRQKYWLELEDQFLREYMPAWTTLVAIALDQLYGDHLTTLAPHR